MENTALWGKAKLFGTLTLETGLHIGGSQTGLDIGGVDNNVIKTPEGVPYIPGSSLKGKLRHLMERLNGKEPNEEVVSGENLVRIHMCQSREEAKSCPVCSLFGTTSDGGEYSGDLIVRDAYLVEDSLSSIKEDLDLEWTEVKFENVLDRVTSRANPRQMERVPAGAKFKWEMIVTLSEKSDLDSIIDITAGLELLEEDYLGGSGSRGYGQLAWSEINLNLKKTENYLDPEKEEECLASGNSIDEFKSELVDEISLGD